MNDTTQLILDTYARANSLRAVAKELGLKIAVVIDTVRAAGVMRRPGAVFKGRTRPELCGKHAPSERRGNATPEEIVAHYSQGHGIIATAIMLDIPDCRVIRAIHDAGVARPPSGKGGLVFSNERGDFVPRDFVWDVDDIVARRAKGETWAHIHKALGVTWHPESLIRHITALRPLVKTKGKGATPPKQLTPAQLDAALAAQERGDTHRQIAERLGISLTHYRRQMYAYKHTRGG
jgi:transposase